MYLVETLDHHSLHMEDTGQRECVDRQSWAWTGGTDRRSRSQDEDQRWEERRFEVRRCCCGRIVYRGPTI